MSEEKKVSRIKPNKASIRIELTEATPKEVWREYLLNGYSWGKAVNEELSYGEPVESFVCPECGDLTIVTRKA